MKSLFVTRKKYDHVIGLLRDLNDLVIQRNIEYDRLKEERDTILGNACQLAANERALRGGQ